MFDLYRVISRHNPRSLKVTRRRGGLGSFIHQSENRRTVVAQYIKVSQRSLKM